MFTAKKCHDGAGRMHSWVPGTHRYSAEDPRMLSPSRGAHGTLPSPAKEMQPSCDPSARGAHWRTEPKVPMGAGHIGSLCLPHTKIPDSQKESKCSTEVMLFGQGAQEQWVTLISKKRVATPWNANPQGPAGVWFSCKKTFLGTRSLRPALLTLVKHKNTKCKNLWEAIKIAVTCKCVGLKAYNTSQEMSQINSLRFHLKNQEKISKGSPKSCSRKKIRRTKSVKLKTKWN